MFQITAGIQYGMRAMINMATSDGQVQSIASISQKENISKKYLESIFTQFKKHKLVRSTRGPEGGYSLAKPAEQISVYEIFEAIDGSPSLVGCLEDFGSCPKSDFCMIRNFWNDYQAYIRQYLDNLTLQDLINKYKKTGDK